MQDQFIAGTQAVGQALKGFLGMGRFWMDFQDGTCTGAGPGQGQTAAGNQR